MPHTDPLEIKAMRTTKTLFTSCLTISLLLVGAAAQGSEQAPAPKSPQGEDKPVVINPFADQPESDGERMIRLFHEVEQRLNRSTDLLFDASKGDLSQLQQVKSSGIDDLGQKGDSRAALAGLLDASRAEGDHILRAIDEILEIAAQNGGS